MRALRFRARADGGITPNEATRREAAVMRARSGDDGWVLRRFPPPMPHFGGINPTPERAKADDPARKSGDVEAIGKALAPASGESAGEEITRQTSGCGSAERRCPVGEPSAETPPGTDNPVLHGDASGNLAPLRRVEPAPPRLTVTIAADRNGQGRRVIAHVIRRALAAEGIVADGPEGLRSVDLRAAIRHLADRDLRVRIEFADPAAPDGGER